MHWTKRLLAAFLREVKEGDPVEIRRGSRRPWESAWYIGRSKMAKHIVETRMVEIAHDERLTVDERNIRPPADWRQGGSSLRGAHVPSEQPAKRYRLTGNGTAPLSRPKAPKPWRSDAYLRFVRQHPCVFSSASCTGPIEAHHHGKHPMGQKTDDSRCVPLCNGHHTELTDKGQVNAALRFVPPSEWHNVRIHTELTIAISMNNLHVEWMRGDR